MNVTERRLHELLRTIPAFQELDVTSNSMDAILIFES
jgi:hypothetical protein